MSSLETLVFLAARMAAVVAAWLITYAIHSTILILLIVVAVFMISHVAPRADAVREALLKTALVGALITVTVQAFVVSGGVRYDLSRAVESVIWDAPETMTPASQPARESYPARLTNPRATVRFLPVALVIAWLGYALWILARVFTADRRARAALGARRPVEDAAVLREFNETAVTMGLPEPLELTIIDRLASPIVIGRSEICLPARALTDLTPDERRSVLAHELAHVVRRDPAWLLVAASIESLFFFQPFNRLIRMRLADETETLADELAAAHSGGGVPLAKGLARVAEWMVAAPERLLAPALVELRSSLVRRIERLMSTPAVPDITSRRILRVACAMIPLAGVIAAAPSVSADDVRAWGSPAFHWDGFVAAGQSIEVKGVMGDMRAEPWDGATVVVNVTRHGRATEPDVRFEVVQHAAGVTICAVYPTPDGQAPNTCQPGRGGRSENTKANDVELDFLVKVPRGVGFVARNALGRISTGLLSGPITAVSNADDIDIATESYASAASGSGNVSVRMGSTAWPDTARIASLSGTVRVTLPTNANTRVRAQSRTGVVHSQFAEIEGDKRSFWSRLALRGSLGSHAQGVLGAGDRVLVLHTVAGDVHIDRVAP